MSKDFVMIGVDFEEGTSDYHNVYIYISKGNYKRFSSGNIVRDFKKALTWAEKNYPLIVWSSSCDDWCMDNENYCYDKNNMIVKKH